jgi:hypothetical protein
VNAQRSTSILKKAAEQKSKIVEITKTDPKPSDSTQKKGIGKQN